VIDEEIRRIVEDGEKRARKLLTEHIDELHALAKGLLEFETLSVDEIKRVIRGEKIIRDTGGPVEPPPAPSGRRSSVPPAGREKPAGGYEPEPQPGG
jgi:cell division protease FtsH